mmetsp:Transcript_26960/g.45935  ORF Transcript_26960/g.45935 Transcript_26960/m.45935 type:complete len:596 (-) Transcript_26960:108-1895(-)|eukprot:CAMPEP_0183740644 /NCGR_PEP_ID=MMETSP0737-20130205/60162_1 /TAXON_ID=385413 /ORGANISM="Thalassiosira miniscula, Strain CCMP1093" /LENGTH=595 /DNA_ID=CAMNT_0025975767 /DNA_START=94 /DNA_END=1881 /DNA_ORIENTATION=+
MASISASTTHKVGIKKTATKGGKKSGILKSGTSSKIRGGSSNSTNGKGGLQRRGSAPRLLPSELNHPTSLDAFLALSPTQQKDRTVNEFLPHCMGERATFHEGIAKPHTASTTQSRGAAAADLATLVKHLGPIVVLKQFGVLAEMEKTLLPLGIGAVFGNGPGKGVHPGGGMRKICSSASLASMDSDNAIRSMGTGSTGANPSTMSIATSSIGTDSKRGKTTPVNAREGALLFLRALCELGIKSVEPYVVPLLAAALDECGSSSSGVRAAAEDASEAIISIANPLAFPMMVVPVIFEALHSPEWRVKSTALERLKQVASVAPGQTSKMLPKIIPTVTSQIWDTKPQVTKAANAALLAVCMTNDNPDVKPAVPAVVHAVSKPADTYKAVEELMATTFVATVDASTLSILCPILSRGLKEKNAIRKRACCVVIENMSRLVDSPNAVAPFGPLLVPELKKVVENVQFEDIRDVALSALQALTRALGHADIESAMASIMRAEAERAEEEQRRIEEALEDERAAEEERIKKEEEERKQFREAMEAQRLLDKLALEEEEKKKKEEMLKKEKQKKSTKSATGKCQGCGLKKCKKTCLFNSGK